MSKKNKSKEGGFSSSPEQTTRKCHPANNGNFFTMLQYCYFVLHYFATAPSFLSIGSDLSVFSSFYSALPLSLSSVLPSSSSSSGFVPSYHSACALSSPAAGQTWLQQLQLMTTERVVKRGGEREREVGDGMVL